MEKEKIDRINELARKSKQGELTAAEARERQALRDEYRAYIRGNLKTTLDNTYIVDDNGYKTKLRRRADHAHGCSCHDCSGHKHHKH